MSLDSTNESQRTTDERLSEVQRLLTEPQSTDEARIQLLLEQATLLEASQNYEAALSSYDLALAIDPDDDEVRFSRSVVLGDLGRWQEALSGYDQLLQLQPDDYPALSHPSTGTFELKRYNPGDDEVWNSRGWALANLGRWQEAILSFDQALQFKPNATLVWNNRGWALSKLDRWQEAILSFDQAIQFKPDEPLGWYNRGNGLFNLAHQLERQGHLKTSATKLAEGLSDCKRALELNSKDDLAWSDQGWALGRLKQYAEAISSYKQALQIRQEKNDRSGELASLQALGHLYAQAGRVQEFWSTVGRAYNLAEDLDVPVEQKLYPVFVRKLMRLAQRGKGQKVLAISAGIVCLPVLFIGFLLLLLHFLLRWLATRLRH